MRRTVKAASQTRNLLAPRPPIAWRETEKNLQLARGRRANRADGASAAAVGRRRPAVAGHTAAQDRRRRLYGAALHADRAVRAAGARRPAAPRLHGSPAAPDPRGAAPAVRPAA